MTLQEFSQTLFDVSPFAFIECYITMERHLKSLMRKISQNLIIQDSFKDVVVRKNVLSSPMILTDTLATDFLMLQLLDQMWI